MCFLMLFHEPLNDCLNFKKYQILTFNGKFKHMNILKLLWRVYFIVRQTDVRT